MGNTVIYWFLFFKCQMSCVNIFVIRTISCGSATSHLLTLLLAQISINIPCVILILLCLFFWHFHSSCVDNLNIHAWLRGKEFKKISTRLFFFLFFFLCHVVSVWHGLVKALTMSNNPKFSILCYSEVSSADTTLFPCELSHLSTDCCCDLVPVWCHKGAQNLKCLRNREVISYKCPCLEGWHMLR